MSINVVAPKAITGLIPIWLSLLSFPLHHREQVSVRAQITSVPQIQRVEGVTELLMCLNMLLFS